MKKLLLEKKRFILLFFVATFCAFMTLFAVACSLNANSPFVDKGFMDEDYVEVQGLRAENTELKMSTTGEPSNFQLDISVVPANATNRALKYFVSSEYHKYVTVTPSGLLTAHMITEGASVPVEITSTTNPNAKLIVTVLVEDVAVQETKFDSDILNLWFEGNPGKVNLIYQPAHAIDGRNAIYTSLNPDIATVDPNGVVTPIMAGNTTIRARCETKAGKIIDSFTSVKVSYAKGEYQLDVSGTANFNQVINNYSAIDFTLLILGEHVDPNPSIEWYVDTERVSTNSDLTQYSHVPVATTPMAYRIKVIVQPYGGDPVTIYSNVVNIHKAFNGIELAYDNLSSIYDSYRYGDEHTFELNSGDASNQIVKYKWYLSEQSDPNHTIYVGDTTPKEKNLTRRLNVAGDYVLVAHAVDINDSVINHSAPFTFSCDRLVAGDTLVINPKLNDYGLPADSYHWYVVDCDENGKYNEREKVFIQDTAAGETFYYPLSVTGNFRFLVTATIDGVGATIYENGKEKEYTHVSDVIRVYDGSKQDAVEGYDLLSDSDKTFRRYHIKDYSSIEDIKIEGIFYNNDYSVFLRWNNSEGLDSYNIEISKYDGTTYILDNKNPKNAVMGNNYCFVPQEIVTLDDVFSVRIKKKDEIYSERYYYGTENDSGLADRTHILIYPHELYKYFNNVAYNNTITPYTISDVTMKLPLFNTYVYDMEDLREITEFILLYKPSSNATIVRSAAENSYLYTVDLYIPFAYTPELAERYPTPATPEELSGYGEYGDIYKIVTAATARSAHNQNYDLRISGGDGKYTISFVLDSKKKFLGFSQPTAKPTASSSTHFTSTPDENAFSFVIDDRDSVYVYDSDTLLYAMQCGFNPVPSGNENLSALFKKIKTVIGTITHNSMTDKEKLLAFYDYLVLNMVFDVNLANSAAAGELTKEEIYLYESYYLEGAFNAKTVVDTGMAKALAAMCGVVGIPCVIVKGKINNLTCFWNKVFIDGNWYVVDAMRSLCTAKSYDPANDKTTTISVIDYTFFMLSDREYATRLEAEVTEFGSAPKANTICDDKDFIHYGINSEEVLRVISSLDYGIYGITFMFNKTVLEDTEQIAAALEQWVNLRNVNISEIVEIFETEMFICAIISVNIRNID